MASGGLIEIRIRRGGWLRGHDDITPFRLPLYIIFCLLRSGDESGMCIISPVSFYLLRSMPK